MLDHLVYVVSDLQQAASRFTALGLPPSPGGRHPGRGTHNLLLRLGPRSYLELLAVDPGTAIPSPRWMGVDAGTIPRISRWALSAGARITERAMALGNFPGISGEIQRGERQLADGNMLRWQLTDPGTEPTVSAVPFLIDWGGPGSARPADALPDLGLELRELRLYHPRAEDVNRFLRAAGSPYVALPADQQRIEAVLRFPSGTLVL